MLKIKFIVVDRTRSPFLREGEAHDQADTIISLSRLTLTHEMSRLFLIEQLYRALTIIEGHKYHR